VIPRLHRRGNSFKGALRYILHDPGKDSSERVGWVETQNIVSDPKDAWFEMFDTYRNRAALKKNAGVDSRGRDNKTPVLHYTLAWHAKDNPDPEHMRAMAFDSLKALGLSDHEAVIACHSDKEHHHVHVVVNTVHPYTGKTAPLKFSKLEFSRWAEAYEKAHGIHCEQRVKNNEKRREIAERRKAEREQSAFALLTGDRLPEPSAFEPVNDNSVNRRRWFERKDVVDRMKALRAALDQEHRVERGETWARQVKERDQLDMHTHAALDRARAGVKDRFKPQWRDLYQSQKREERRLREVATHPFERAVFLFRNRARLGERGKPLTVRQMIPLILSRKKLRSRVEQIHMRDRRAMARVEKAHTKQHTDELWQAHRAAFNALRDRQAAVRAAERRNQTVATKEITFARAKDELSREADERTPRVPQVLPRPERQPVQRKPEPAPVADKRMAMEKLAPDQPSSRAVPVAPKPHQTEPTKPVPMKAQAPRMPVVPPRPERQATTAKPQPAPVADKKMAMDRLSSAQASPRGVPVAPKALKPEIAKAILLRDQPPPGQRVPSVPVKAHTAPVAPQREPQKAAKPFRDAVSPDTPRVAKDFREAAAPDQKRKVTSEQERKERMRKDMENWKRRSARDDFDRDR
jgi:hypothetical protein